MLYPAELRALGVGGREVHGKTRVVKSQVSIRATSLPSSFVQFETSQSDRLEKSATIAHLAERPDTHVGDFSAPFHKEFLSMLV